VSLHSKVSFRPWPTISIVIPSFNYGRYLERAISSVLSQSYPHRQLIVIDGASRDDTADVLDRYRDRLDVCISEPDAGQTDALNKGFRHVRGELFNWLNADDELLPDCLLTMAEEWRRGCDLIIGQSCNIREEINQTDLSPIYRPFYGSYFDFQVASFRGFLPQPAVFVSTLLARQAFPLSNNLRQVMDYQFHLRILRHSPRISLVRKPVVNFYYHGLNMSLSRAPKLPELVEVCEGEIALATGLRRLRLGFILDGAIVIHRWIHAGNPPRVLVILKSACRNPALLVRPLWWNFLLKGVKHTLEYFWSPPANF
jgi:glycosyltransferase involved in cell wall biosynthesis